MLFTFIDGLVRKLKILTQLSVENIYLKEKKNEDLRRKAPGKKAIVCVVRCSPQEPIMVTNYTSSFLPN